MRPLTVGYFPYNPSFNPYQRLFADAVAETGTVIRRLPPRKLFPLQFAAAQDVDVLQFDWPHDWYQGRNVFTRQLKRWMYRDGLKRLSDVRVVWTAHNLQGHGAEDVEDERRMIQALIDVCDGIIVLSNEAEKLLRGEYQLALRTRVQVIQHGHYIDCYPNTVSRKEARTRLGLPERAGVVLSLGRLQPYKGLEKLIESFSNVADRGDVLLLAGKSVSKQYTVQLRQMATLHSRKGVGVEIRDELVPDEELQVYFNACDVVALPFRRVLNSGSLLLAMSFGCPVVAPRVGSIPEVACPEGWFVYKPDERQGLARALRSALSRDDLVDLRRPVTAFTAARYGWARVGADARDLYRELVA